MDYETCESLVRREINNLARSSNPEKESWHKLKSVIIRLAECIRITTGQTRPPIILEEAKQLRNIHHEILFVTQKGPDALLSPTDDGFLLRLKKGQSDVRHRFSIAHEIGHTFFYDIHKKPPIRLLSYASSSRFSRKEEDICSAFARELLLPRDMLLDEIKNVSNEENVLQFLITIARKYKVSIEVLIWRLLRDLSELKNSVGLFRISQDVEKANQIRIRRYYGEAIKSYMRKREKQVIEGVLEILQSNNPHKSLEDISSVYSDYVKIYKRESSSGLQSVVMLSFKRDV